MDLRLSLPPWATSCECDLDAALPVLLPPQHSLPCPCGWAGGARVFPEHPPTLLPQPAAPGQAEGHGGADPVGGADPPEQPG